MSKSRNIRRKRKIQPSVTSNHDKLLRNFMFNNNKTIHTNIYTSSRVCLRCGNIHASYNKAHNKVKENERTNIRIVRHEVLTYLPRTSLYKLTSMNEIKVENVLNVYSSIKLKIKGNNNNSNKTI